MQTFQVKMRFSFLDCLAWPFRHFLSQFSSYFNSHTVENWIKQLDEEILQAVALGRQVGMGWTLPFEQNRIVPRRYWSQCRKIISQQSYNSTIKQNTLIGCCKLFHQFEPIRHSLMRLAPGLRTSCLEKQKMLQVDPQLRQIELYTCSIPIYVQS